MAMQEFKLKDLSSLDVKEGTMKEVEVEGVEEGKVLLLKLNNKVHVTSSKCTHYGAPLVKGVLSGEGDGRLTCPWHGACFNLSSGDVEDAPAVDPIAKFDVFEKNGGVYIKAEEQTIKKSRRQIDLKCSVSTPEKVVIVGGGSGTFGALEGLRNGGFRGSITVLSREPYPPIDRTKLSKALITDLSAIQLRDEEWFKKASIDRIEDDVVSVDFEGKTVSTASGKKYPYTKLILATGGQPRMLPTPGFKKLDNVFLLRTVPDAEKIVSAVGENGKKVVVVGSSFIGMEVANCLAQKKNTVTVVGMEKAPMERIMGEKVGKIFQGLLEKSGVKFHMEASADSAHPSTSSPSKVGWLQLTDGTKIEADVIVLGVGVQPATQFIKDNPSVTLLKDGSLETDESLAVKGLEDVYAIGDIATYPYHGPGASPGGSPTRIEHWNVAQNHGRSVARSIIHPGIKPKAFIPIFWSALVQQLRYCGNAPNGWDDVVLKGDPDNAKFAAYYTHGQEVVAVATMMMDPVMTKCAELMRRKRMPSKSEIENGVDVLEISLIGEGVKI